MLHRLKALTKKFVSFLPKPLKPMKIAVLVSGNGSNLQALIDFGLSGEIVGVLSNKPEAYALQRAHSAGIACRVIQHQDFPTRALFDAEMQKQLIEWQVDIVVLAGFMRILTPNFVNSWQGKMLNVHPSLLPAYKGINTHQRVLHSGDVMHGCSVHFVTPELDAGPCVAQGILQVQPNEKLAELAARVHQLEHLVYPQVVEWLCTQLLRFNTQSNQALLFRGQPILQPIRFCL